MKYFCIHCGFLFVIAFNLIFAAQETQNTGEKTEIQTKTLTAKELQDVEKDKKKSFILIGEAGYYVLPICVFRGKGNSFIYSLSERKDTFAFCPPEVKLTGELKNCLVPSKMDSCKESVEPFIMPVLNEDRKHKTCANEKGKLYTFAFQACNYSGSFLGSGNKELYRLTPKTMYSFCYDHKSEQILYTFRKIISPKLLENPLLEEDRKTTYIPRTTDFNLFNNRFEKIKNLFSEESLAKSGYVMQYIVPPEDMAFRIWKRAIYHLINVKLVLKKTAKLFDHINEHIREKAIHRLGEVRIADGFQPSDSLEVNIWWKIIYSGSLNSAIAIVIHNTEKPPSPEEKLCDESICEKYKWKGLITDDMVSHAYCCLADVIAKNNDLPVTKSPLNPETIWKKVFKSAHHFHRWFC